MKFPNFFKKGVGAPNLIIAITVLIIIYILFLPPQDRASLLGESNNGLINQNDNSNNNYQNNYNFVDEVVLEAIPGNIDYTELNELEIPLNSFTLINNVDATILEEYNPFYIKNGIGDKISKNLTLNIPNLNNVDNVQLVFETKVHKGVLNVKVNGNTVYQYDINTIQPGPIKIKKSLLSTENSIEFEVSGVGINFWETNQYSLEDIKVIAEVSDTSRQNSLNTFYITEEQGNSIEKARLKFNPDCNVYESGVLTITLNDRVVFSGIPDCGSLNFVDFAPNLIYIGKNKINFNSESGSYLIDLISLKLELEDNEIPVYYFELDDQLFNLYNDNNDNAKCGEMDGICPDPCDEDNDYDCCMQEYTTPHWCVAQTDNSDDKCVGAVTEQNYERCPTMYIDRNGNIAGFEINDEDSDDLELCGDNEDGECPSGCSIYKDKDCCFDQSGDQFWCEFMPTNGLNARCTNSVSLGQCDICPVGFEGEDEDPICSPYSTGDEIEELKSSYDAILTMKFTDDFDRKKADIYINGHLTRLDTRSLAYQKDISAFVEPGSNSVEIVPFSSLNIRELTVEVVN